MSDLSRRENGLIVGLSAAGGEGDFVGRTVQAAGDCHARLRDCLACDLTHFMGTRSISEGVLQKGHHRIEGFWIEGSRGCIIGIDHHSCETHS